MLKGNKPLYILLVLVLILTACQSRPATPEPVVETAIVTQEVDATPVEVIQVLTPTPEPEGGRTLVICLERPPDTLYVYSDLATPSTYRVFEAIADGGWKAYDNNSFGYQPVLLEKMPSLADGDATLTVVAANEGDRVVDASGNVVSLDPSADPPIMLVPAGGGDPVPYQGGEFAMEQLSVTFHLLPGLLWSDGEPLTATDSVYAFNLLEESDAAPTQNLLADGSKVYRTASYQAIDNLTTVWTGLPGFRDSSYFTNFFGPAPEHSWGEYSADELKTAEVSHRKPIGWGPYVIDEWVSNESITLRKNPNYFRAGEGLPKFDTLIIRYFGENGDANLAAFLAGECDIFDGPKGDMSRILDLHNSGQIKARYTIDAGVQHLDFGIQHVEYDDGYQPGVDRPDFFSDVRTRRAFALCTDRQALVDNIWFGQAKVLDTYLTPVHPLYNPDVSHYDFDPAAGSALLEEVGWLDEDGDPDTPRIARGVANVPEGTPLVVTYQTTSIPVREQISGMVKESLAQCGIQANIQLSVNPELFADIFGRKFDLGMFGWGSGANPPCHFFLSREIPGPAGEEWVSIQDGSTRTFSDRGWDGWNDPGFVDEEYERACNTAMSSLPGTPEYKAAHLEAQRIFAEQLPIVPLFTGFQDTISRPDMCGLIMDPSNSALWNIEEFDYGEGCEG